MIERLSQYLQRRLFWATVASSAFILEVIALYFQYGMSLEPCVMCIYQRTAVFAILCAATIACFAPHSPLVRYPALLVYGVGSLWGWLIAQEHVAMQHNTDPFAFACSFEPNFPNFLPLHQWLPEFFAATGSCGNIDWQFLSLSMPNWMMIIFAGYSISFILFLYLEVHRLYNAFGKSS